MKKMIFFILAVTFSLTLSGCSNKKYPTILFNQSEFLADGSGVVEIEGKLLNGGAGVFEANINRKPSKVKVDKDQIFHIKYQMTSDEDTDFYLGIKDKNNRIAVGTIEIDSSQVEKSKNEFEIIRTSDIIGYFEKYNVPFSAFEEHANQQLPGVVDSVVFNMGTRIDGTAIKEGVYLFEDEKYWNKAIFSVLDWWDHQVSVSNNKDYSIKRENTLVDFLDVPNLSDLAKEKMIKQDNFFDNNHFLWIYRDKEKLVLVVADPELSEIERGRSVLAIQNLLIDRTFVLDKDEGDPEEPYIDSLSTSVDTEN